MNKEKLTREINELIIKICEYYGVLGNEQKYIYKYLKDCEKALMDLLNEFDKDGKKINNLKFFNNVFEYKENYEILEKDFERLENKYENEKDDNYDLTKQVEKYEKEIEKLQEKIADYEYEIEHAQNSLKK